MYRHPPRAFYTHNSYILKLRRLTLYQYNVHKKKKICLPNYPNGLWRAFKGAWGRVVRWPWRQPTLGRQRRHTPPERHITCHFLFLPLDNNPDSQSWRPPWKSTKTTVYERLDPKRAIHWVVNLIFTTTETHDNAHAPTTCIQHSILQYLRSQTCISNFIPFYQCKATHHGCLLNVPATC